jgi:high-affinity nickel-transport protein
MSLKHRVAVLYAGLAAANIGCWLAALVAFRHFPVLLGTAGLAYGFGLRHAVDADHIAAIDNVTRKLMQEGKRPVTTGLFFSLGHSTVVVVLSAVIALTAAAVQARFGALAAFGTVTGTVISAGFLFVLAGLNFAVLVSVWRMFRRVKAGAAYREETLQDLLGQRGFLSRLFGRLFRLVTAAPQMYFVGLLFGLGFDTATEIGVLGIAAAEAAKGLNIWAIMIFPALFTAGMSLVDATDNVVMLGAYGFAFTRPLRKLYYNITITLVSVLVAVLVGGVEVLGLLRGSFALTGPFWGAVGAVNGHFGMLGYGIIGLFVASWMAAVLVYRLGNYDAIAVTVTE